MRKAIKIVIWAAAFLASAGIGAYIAANSEPFPPDVDRPLAAPGATVAPAPSPAPRPARWVATFRSSTYHQLYYGGRCTTNWRGSLRFNVFDTGVVEGKGVIVLAGRLECDFPIAQVQARRLTVDVVGRVRGRRATLRLTSGSISPDGSRDYGGLFAMLPVRFEMRLSGAGATAQVNGSRLDEQGRGTFVWSSVVRAKPVSA